MPGRTADKKATYSAFPQPDATKISVKLRQPGSGTYNKRLQGGVEFPTGGRGRKARARERFRFRRKVSRSGPMPEPTVKLFPVRRGGSQSG